MIIYIDEEFKCHLNNDGTRREFDVSAFPFESPRTVECFRYVPIGETWIREDGVEFTGEMICPFVDSSKLEFAEENYKDGIDSQDGTIAELLDAIEDLCNEVIG